MQTQDGIVTTDPVEMAAALRAHWAAVFRSHAHDSPRLDAWLEEERQLGGLDVPHVAAGAWQVRRRDVRRALEQSPSSAPGPDGIPFVAWRRLGHLAVDVLASALGALSQEDGLDQLRHDFGEDFNHGLMVFLPKKPSGTTAAGLDYFTPADVRPLNIVNCDNRLLANAVRMRLESVLSPWVSADQRGFVPGRSMLQNVMDVDGGMMEVALECESGGALFVDFSAAFPSISHEYLKKVLRALSLPAHFLRYVEVLYHGVTCELVVCSRRLPGFAATAGIRQGCPLSPLLFAVVGDLWLRRLRRAVPTSVVRAYADDIAILFRDLVPGLRAVMPVFLELAAVAGLHVNVQKTVVVPLGDQPLDAVRADLATACPGWGGLRLAYSASYLGFVLGPARGDATWDGPLRKVLDRAAAWGARPLGLQLAAAAWNGYALSTCAFVAQLDALPAAWDAVEARALRRLVPGPGNWCQPRDLHLLRRGYHFPRAFADLRPRALAAKMRVLHFEAEQSGGLKVDAQARRLDAAAQTSDHLNRLVQWAAWFDSAFCRQLRRARARCLAQGIRHEDVLHSLAGAAPRPWTTEVWLRIRRGYQRAITLLLTTDAGAEVHARLRQRLSRYELTLFPRARTLRGLAVLPRLAKLVPPRVHAAVLRTWWNGWLTTRRYRAAGLPSGMCMFGCCGMLSDAIEHYSVCPVV